MRLIIFGATGGTGRCLVTQALAQGHAVTAFVRNPATLDLQHRALRLIQGDVFDPQAVTRAVAGHDAVLNALGGKPGLSSALTGRTPRRPVCSVGTQHILDAMEQHGVRRIVCETMHGIGESKQQTTFWRRLVFDQALVTLFLRDEVDDKQRQEQIIRRSSRDWIIVRPTQLTDGPRTGRYRVGTELQLGLMAKIARADVAAFMLEQLTQDTYLRQTPGISNEARLR